MIALVTLNPRWLGLTRPSSGEQLEFDCPACGPAHRLVAVLLNPLDGSPGAPWLGKPVKGSDGQETIAPAWSREGETFDVLSLVPSLVYPCWHGWVEEGQVIDTREATHSLLQVPIDARGQQCGEAMRISLSPRQVAGMRKAGRIS